MVAPSDNASSGEPPKRGKKPAPTTSVTGRPSEYDPIASPAAAYAVCQMGGTEAQLAESLGVAIQTTYNWRKLFPEFLEAIKRGKQAADDNVEASLYQRAMGYSHPDTHIAVLRDGTVIEHPIIKRYPPSETALIFWLKNRRPREWRDRIEVHAEVEHKLNDAEMANAFATSFKATAPIMQRVVAAIEMRNLTPEKIEPAGGQTPNT